MKSKMDKMYGKIAKRNGTTPQEVKREMELAIAEARSNPSAKIREFWSNFPSKNETPTVEEVVAYLCEELGSPRINGESGARSL